MHGARDVGPAAAGPHRQAAAAPASRARPRGAREDRRGVRAGLFAWPALLIFLGFVAYPVLWIALRSLAPDTAPGSPRGAFANYLRAFADPVFWIAMRNMALWAIITIPVQMAFGGLIALLIERYTRRSRAFFRTMFFLPVVTSVSVVAIVWSQMYAPYYGIVQAWLQRLGLTLGIALLADPRTVIFALIVVNIWQWTGFSMMMYVAGINAIPEDIFDAARIDGARFRHLVLRVVVPLVAPVTKSLLLLGVIGTLQTFPIVYLMTGGGPDHASEVFGTEIFRQGIVLGNTGYGAALSVLVLVLSLALSLLQITALGAELAPRRAREEAVA